MFTKQELNLILLNRKQNKLHELIEYLNGPIHKRALDGFSFFNIEIEFEELKKLLSEYNFDMHAHDIMEVKNDFKSVTNCDLNIEYIYNKKCKLNIFWE